MNRRLSLAVVAIGALVIGGCGPYADRDLTYKQVDEAFLADTTVVIAAASPMWSSNPKGATLFVDRDGSVKRIDNAGMDSVHLAHEDGRVGFSDVERDYILGRDRIVSKRNTLDDGSQVGNGFVADNLVSVFYDSELAESDSVAVARTGGGPAFSGVRGDASAVAQCDSGLWMVGPSVPGDAGYVEEDLETESQMNPVMVRPVEPKDLPPIEVKSPGLYGGTVTVATCDGNHLVAAPVYSDGSDLGLLSVDVVSGKSTTFRVEGYLQELLKLPEDEPWTIEAETLKGTDLYLVTERSTKKGQRFDLARVDISTGESEKVASIKATTDVSTHFRFAEGVLHVLDVTWRDPSRVRALSLEDGKELGSLEFDWIEPKLNSRFTTEDRALEVFDFVVLQPGLVSELGQSEPTPEPTN